MLHGPARRFGHLAGDRGQELLSALGGMLFDRQGQGRDRGGYARGRAAGNPRDANLRGTGNELTELLDVAVVGDKHGTRPVSVPIEDRGDPMMLADHNQRQASPTGWQRDIARRRIISPRIGAQHIAGRIGSLRIRGRTGTGRQRDVSVRTGVWRGVGSRRGVGLWSGVGWCQDDVECWLRGGLGNFFERMP